MIIHLRDFVFETLGEGTDPPLFFDLPPMGGIVRLAETISMVFSRIFPLLSPLERNRSKLGESHRERGHGFTSC